MSTLRAAVFDLDGLLVNTEDLYEQAGQTVLQRRGKTYDAELKEQMMGRPVVDAMRLMIECHSLPDPLEDLMCECRDVLDGLLATSLDVMPGARELIDDLQKAQMPIGVATSATAEYADYVLTRLELKQRFEFVLTAEDIRHGKPAPDVYLLAAQRLELPPAEMLVLEDSANGCRAAVAAGVFTVAVPNRHTRNHSFPKVQLAADSLADPRIRKLLRLA